MNCLLVYSDYNDYLGENDLTKVLKLAISSQYRWQKVSQI